MPRLRLLPLLLCLAVIATGCGDQNTVIADPPPTVGAQAQFLTPAYNNEVITLFSSNDRLIVTKHKATSIYSGASTTIYNEFGDSVLDRTNKEYRHDGVYWMTSAINQNDFQPAIDGRYQITATYYTNTPTLGAGNEIQIRSATMPFSACAPTNLECRKTEPPRRYTAHRRIPASVAVVAVAAAAVVEAARAPITCDGSQSPKTWSRSS